MPPLAYLLGRNQYAPKSSDLNFDEKLPLVKVNGLEGCNLAISRLMG